MVIRLPGQPQSQLGGPQPGPEPAWARFTRTVEHGQPTRVSLQAYKPDIAAYKMLGRAPQSHSDESADPRERNSHNSSVYIAPIDRYKGKPASNVARLPVVGEIAEGGVVVEKALARGGAYALRVRGTSMTHVGIEPGDVVIVRPQNWADNGDFVVANFTDGLAGGSEGLATLKRFYKRRDHVFLQSATASTDPIRLFPNNRNGAGDRDSVKVQGVVTMVLKAQ